MDKNTAIKKINKLAEYCYAASPYTKAQYNFEKIFYTTSQPNYQTRDASDDHIINGGRLANNILLPTFKYFIKDKKLLTKNQICIISFKRSKTLNDKIQGSETSDHMIGAAVDFQILNTSDDTLFTQVFEHIRDLYGYTQLITEYYINDSGNYVWWIHVSLVPGREKERQVIKSLDKYANKTNSSAGSNTNNKTINIGAAISEYSNDKNLSKDFLTHVMVQYDKNDLNLDLPGILKRDVFRKSDRQSEWTALNPITISMTIDGMSGINIGNAFMLDVLPSVYEQNGVLQITELSDEITSSGWKTTISAIYRIKGKSKTAADANVNTNSKIESKKSNETLDK